MATTDQALLTEVQYALVEPTIDGGVTWAGLWSALEVTDALNRRQRQFLKETAAVLTQTTLPTIPNTHRHALPADWIATVAVAWLRPDGVSLPLEPATELDGEFAVPTWEYVTGGDPLVYTDVELPTLELQILPASLDAGVIDLIYQAAGPPLSNIGALLTVPDECAWIIKWGVLADLLGKVGRGADPARAAYAEARYRLGVRLVRAILRGGWY